MFFQLKYSSVWNIYSAKLELNEILAPGQTKTLYFPSFISAFIVNVYRDGFREIDPIILNFAPFSDSYISYD